MNLYKSDIMRFYSRSIAQTEPLWRLLVTPIVIAKETLT